MANRRVAAVRAPRRDRLWLGWSTPRITLPAPPTSNKQVIVGSSSFLLFGKPTIARIRGYLRIQYDVSAAAAGVQGQWAVGITTMSDAAGITHPLPMDDAGHPWLWWAAGHLTNPSSSGCCPSDGITIEIDSKSMRIVRQTYEMIIVYQNVTAYEGVSSIFECSSAGRILIMPS